MPPDPAKEQNLERAIHRVLRSLPPQPAPRSLERNVLAEIARRAALPWWRQSFLHWPVAARAAFLLVSIGVVRLALAASTWIRGSFDGATLRETFAPAVAWMQDALAVANVFTAIFETILRNIPHVWLYGTIGVLAAAYAMLFGLGAAAYKTLLAPR